MYDTSSSTPALAARPLDWHIEGTGGNCTAFVARSRRAEYYIVATEGFRPPVAGESCTLGVWDGEDERVSEHPCRLAAVAAAERYERDAHHYPSDHDCALLAEDGEPRAMAALGVLQNNGQGSCDTCAQA